MKDENERNFIKRKRKNKKHREKNHIERRRNGCSRGNLDSAGLYWLSITFQEGNYYCGKYHFPDDKDTSGFVLVWKKDCTGKRKAALQYSFV